MVLLSGSVPNRTPGATANDGVEPGITHLAARYGGLRRLRKKPATTDEGKERHDHGCRTVIGSDGGLIGRRRQSGCWCVCDATSSAESLQLSGRGIPGGNAFVNRGVVGQPFVSRGVAGNPLVGRGVPNATPFVAHRVSSDHRFAFIGHRRVHGRHLHGFIPGIGYAYYWYYDDCYVLTDDCGWINNY
jgi:hypothetical protein